MKRCLHALAALWPERRGEGSPPLPDTRIGILQHGAAVLRMDKILSECVDLPIRKFAKETVGAGALGELVRSDGGLKLLKRQQSKSANTQIRESATKPLLTVTAWRCGGFLAQKFIKVPSVCVAQMFIRIPSAAILPNRCCLLAFFVR